MSDTETVEIKNRFTGDVMFTAQVEAGLSKDRKLGAAVRLAVKADAVLADANLAGANAVIDAGTPNGWRAVGWRRGGTLRVRVGCRDFTLAEGREYWRGKSERREVMAALDYIEAVARLRGWPEAGETKQAA